MDRAEEIINQINDDPNHPDVGVLANDLLKEFSRGYPLEHLRPLLLNLNPDVAEIGMWVTSELGQGAKPLLSEVVALLKHPAKSVRYLAIDSVLSCTTELDKSEVAAVLPLLDDPEAAVRWKAMGFLSRASLEQLHGALDYFSTSEPDSVYINGLKWLLSEDAGNPEEIISILQKPDAILRKYGVVAAVRASRSNSQPLLYASSVDDPDVKRFATDMLKLK